MGSYSVILIFTQFSIIISRSYLMFIISVVLKKYMSSKKTESVVVQHVTSVAEFKRILESNSKVVVKFGAPWCTPCVRIAPTYQNLSQKYSHDIVFLEVDVDQAENPILTFVQVSGIPRFVAYHKQKKVGDMTGANEQDLTNLVQKLSRKT